MLSNRMNASFIDYASFGIADPNLRAKCARLQKPENLNNVRILEMIEALQPISPIKQSRFCIVNVSRGFP
jgi:hypothetical protein